MMLNFLFRLYRLNHYKLRRFIQRLVIRFDNTGGHKGECWSPVLRKIYSEYYNVNIGNGSYGCFDISRFPQGTRVGSYCSIAAGARYFNANHSLDQFTTHPMIFNASIYKHNGSWGGVPLE